jgi:hypothetical protein
MKVVIEISKEKYMYLKDAFESGDWEQQRIAEMNSAELLLHKGTILQGHGRLIDADALFEDYEKTGWYNNADRDEVAEKIVLDAPTIIEADKEDD